MEKNYRETKIIDSTLQKVWEVISKPADLRLDGEVATTKESDTKWIEHTGSDIDNINEAVLDEVQHSVTIQTMNSKYKSEHNTLILSVKEVDNGVEITIDFTLRTTAIANVLVMKIAGDKIEHGAVEKMFRHIEKAL